MRFRTPAWRRQKPALPRYRSMRTPSRPPLPAHAGSNQGQNARLPPGHLASPGTRTHFERADRPAVIRVRRAAGDREAVIAGSSRQSGHLSAAGRSSDNTYLARSARRSDRNRIISSRHQAGSSAKPKPGLMAAHEPPAGWQGRMQPIDARPMQSRVCVRKPWTNG